jgi:hypothetical protein
MRRWQYEKKQATPPGWISHVPYLDGWREKETRASLCFGPRFEKALAAFFELRMPAKASIQAGRIFRGLSGFP